MKKIKKPISILLSVLMVLSVFAVVPFTASAAVGDFVPETEYLTFTAEEAGSSVTLNYTNGTLKYNKNNSDWVDYTKGAQIDLENAGDSVRFRGKDTTFNNSSKHVSIGGKVACSGNVMSLRLDDNDMVQGLSGSCFKYMFKDCTGLTAAPKLPETTLATYCYDRMFSGCTSLTTAPALPATTLAKYCYNYMFSGCTSLTTAPALPATTLAKYCYNYMFSGCTSLTTAPALPATTLATYCYSYMFDGCTSLTTAPELPATTLESSCYQNMFSGCTSLTTAPALPATTLVSNCYQNMFSGCTSLTTAPELPATTLAQYCYSRMFYDCTSLTTAPALPAATLATYCYNNMFFGCISLTTAPELPATTLKTNCYTSMFSGCTSLTTAPELPATTLVSNCYKSMFNGCTGIKLSEMQTAEYSIPYSVPSGGNGTTASNALDNMFANTGGTFKGTPEINKTYYRPAAKYTVTWKNDDGTILKTDTVEEGNAPAYTGTAPVKADDEQNTYTFSGWTDGTNTYGKDDALPEVTGDITYTATFDETAKTFKAYVKKLTGDTYTIENLTGETTVAQLKEIIADQIDIPATAQRLIFAGKELDDAKTLAEYNIGEESTIHLIIRGYTVTWLNYDNSELGTKTVQYGATPTYDGETPEKGEDENYTYTFSGWTDGTNTYGKDDTLPAVTGDITYTATFDAVPKIPVEYYIVGTMNEWKTSDAYKLTKNPANDAEYMFTDLTVSANTELKVKDSNGAWYPEAENFKLNDAGTYDIYFRPDGQGGDGWHYGNIFANNYRLPTYTVTWKNADGTTLKTDTVDKDAIPAYTGTTPEKAEDAENTYTFSGWTDGTNTYGASDTLPAVTGDITYTATFTASEKHLNGPQDDGFFYLDDVKQLSYQLIKWEGDYYFINDNDKYAKNNLLYLGQNFVAGTDIEPGFYTFGADGKMVVKNGPDADGYFYINNAVCRTLYRFVEFEGDWYFINDGYKYAKNVHLYLSGAFLEGTDFAPGYFDFDADGKYYIPEELPEGANADGYFYINGVKQTRYQLIKYGNDYYFINDDDKYAKNTKLYLSSTYVSGTDLPAGLYEFGADGKMIISVTKNGPQDDGYFYINGARCQKLYRFVEFEGDWYFINDGYKYAKNARLYLGNAFLEGTDFAPGYFVFGADGKLVTA